jgi:hypothetical protein
MIKNEFMQQHEQHAAGPRWNLPDVYSVLILPTAPFSSASEIANVSFSRA